MKISALIASLVLGVSGVAAAAPGPAVHAPFATTTVAYRPMNRVHQPRWTLLDTQVGRAGRNVIELSTTQRFSKLSIKATRGSAMIDKVLVTYANGRTQAVDLNQRINTSSAAATVDLAGGSRQISKIVVMSQGRAASYQVFAI